MMVMEAELRRFSKKYSKYETGHAKILLALTRTHLKFN